MQSVTLYYLCCSSSNEYFMRHGNIASDARCVRILSSCITHDNIWQHLVPDNLPATSQRPSHALQPLLSSHFQRVDAHGAVAWGRRKRAPDKGGSGRVVGVWLGFRGQRRLISVRSEPKTRTNAASASAERIEAGWIAVKVWAAVQGEARCRRMSVEMGDMAIADDMAFTAATPVQCHRSCFGCCIYICI